MAIILGMLLASVANADPYEDGLEAYRRGRYEQALRLWQPLAEQGHAKAQYNLGVFYDLGRGVAQDHAEAVKWYRLAADQGNDRAQNSLGIAYISGKGVPKNHVQAHLWFNLAASQGFSDAAVNRDEVAEEMTAAQIAEAQRLAASWKPKSR